MARGLLEDGEFIEIMSPPRSRNASGAIRKASIAGRGRRAPNFTGINQPYETPETPEISLDTSVLSAEAACEHIVGYLQEHRYV